MGAAASAARCRGLLRCRARRDTAAAATAAAGKAPGAPAGGHQQQGVMCTGTSTSLYSIRMRVCSSASASLMCHGSNRGDVASSDWLVGVDAVHERLAQSMRRASPRGECLRQASAVYAMCLQVLCPLHPDLTPPQRFWPSGPPRLAV